MKTSKAKANTAVAKTWQEETTEVTATVVSWSLTNGIAAIIGAKELLLALGKGTKQGYQDYKTTKSKM